MDEPILLDDDNDSSSSSSSSSNSSVWIARHLQDMTQQGRFVVTLFYLLILVVCFVVPLFYYFRICCEVRREQRLLRRTELETIRAAMEQSVGSSTTAVNRAETLAMKKKYMEEKKARILQLLGPVRLTLREEHFVELVVDDDDECDEENVRNNTHDDDDGDSDDNGFIRIPAPGLFLDGSPSSTTCRLAPSTCTICLTTYIVGSEIVWSSNSACDHVFHADCAEQWLARQREGPLCPCCRRDFIVDPYEELEDNDETNIAAGAETTTRVNQESASTEY